MKKRILICIAHSDDETIVCEGQLLWPMGLRLGVQKLKID